MINNLFRKILVFIIGFLLFILSSFIFYTCRKKIIGRDRQKIVEIEGSDKPIIYATWHGRLYIMSYMKLKNKDTYAVISRHFDGDIIASYLKLRGSKSIRGSVNRGKDIKKGSKNRGGVTVLRNSEQLLKNGGSLGITPDGPKGPARKFKPNIIKIASKTEAYIIPLSFSAKKAKIFKSWDKFMLPLPFSKIYVVFDEPKSIPSNISEKDIEKYGLELENKLNKITDYADSLTKQN